VKLGMIVNLTGPYQTLGGYDKKAADQAIQEINNKGGINGRRVDLEIIDDQTKPDQAVTAYQTLVDHGVSAVVGPAFSNSDLAFLPLTDQKKVPVVAVAASDAIVEPVHPYAFITAPTTTLLATNMLKYLKASNLTKIVLAHDTTLAYSDSGTQHMNELKGQYGVTITDETYQSTQTDFTPMMQHVKAANPQALLVWGTGAAPVTITKAYAASGLKIPLIMTAAEGTPLYYKPLGKDAEGVTVQVTLGVIGPSVPSSNPAKKLIDAAASTYSAANNGEYPPQFFWDAYVACQLIFDAIKRKGDKPSAVKDALESSTLLTPQGQWKYTKTQHWGLPPESIIMAEVKNATFVPNDFGKATLAGQKQ
jgi:branched-chain amino acid transport system substrate-binding protein